MAYQPLESNDKKEKLEKIINSIFDLKDSNIDLRRRNSIEDFIISTVNGDHPKESLAINANLDKNKEGVILYVLTNARLIKIDISNTEIKSSIYPLNTLIGIDRKLTNDGRIEFSISFKNGAFGLRYAQDRKDITEFFQKVEQGQ